MSMCVAAAERLDRRAAGVARGRADDGRRAAPRSASTWSISRASNCIATSLKASVGPWNSSSTHWPAPSWTSGVDRGMAETWHRPRRSSCAERRARCRRATKGARSPPRRPRHRACRRSPRSVAARSAASSPAGRGRHRGQPRQEDIAERQDRCASARAFIQQLIFPHAPARAENAAF